MSIDVRFCSVCGARYNGSEYSTCPYCANGAQADTRGRGLRGLFGGKRARQKAQNPAPAPEANSPYVYTPQSQVPPQSGEQQLTKTKVLTQNMPEPIKPTERATPKEQWFVDAQDSFFQQQQSPTGGTVSSNPVSPWFQQEVPNENPAPPNFPSEGYPAPNPPAPNPLQNPPAQNPPALSTRIDSIGKTVSRVTNNFSDEMEEVIYPVVGWLVCVKGVYFGKSFPLRSGINKISRSADAAVALLKDISVSRGTALKIIYDAIANEFSAEPSDDALSYINGKRLKDSLELKGYEKIWLGDSQRNEFIFLPFCGEQFQWPDNSAEEGTRE